jgi:hypothetical protein
MSLKERRTRAMRRQRPASVSPDGTHPFDTVAWPSLGNATPAEVPRLAEAREAQPTRLNEDRWIPAGPVWQDLSVFVMVLIQIWQPVSVGVSQIEG